MVAHPDPLSALLAQTGIPSTSVALDIRSVDGERLVAHNADVAFKPASVMKLVTTAAALELLGPGYRWITRLHSAGEIASQRVTVLIAWQGRGSVGKPVWK